METNKNSNTDDTQDVEGNSPNNKTAGRENDDFNQNDWDENVETDKYLAMEQHGITYTRESSATLNSDYAESENIERQSEKWTATGVNSRNADAFNQDDYILNDNIDLDEDQNISISSDDI